MLDETDGQGGWAGAVWEFADAVNGGPGIMTGLGPMPPDRSLAGSGLGCAFD